MSDESCAGWEEAMVRLGEKDARIAELEAQIAPMLDGSYGRILRERIAELEAAYNNSMELGLTYHGRIEQLSALLNRVPHDYVDDEYAKEPRCHDDCPACAWAETKEKT